MKPLRTYGSGSYPCLAVMCTVSTYFIEYSKPMTPQTRCLICMDGIDADMVHNGGCAACYWCYHAKEFDGFMHVHCWAAWRPGTCPLCRTPLKKAVVAAVVYSALVLLCCTGLVSLTAWCLLFDYWVPATAAYAVLLLVMQLTRTMLPSNLVCMQYNMGIARGHIPTWCPVWMTVWHADVEIVALQIGVCLAAYSMALACKNVLKV
jgi:hypothetical protein